MPGKTAPPARESLHPACSSLASDCRWGTRAYDHRSASAPAAAPVLAQKNARSVPAERGDRRRLVPELSVQTTATGSPGPRAQAPAWTRKNDKNCFCSPPQQHTTRQRSPLCSCWHKSPLLQLQLAALWHHSVVPWPAPAWYCVLYSTQYHAGREMSSVFLTKMALLGTPESWRCLFIAI